MKILGVGIVTMDIINQVTSYPDEDDEVRAVSQRISRGGNVANTLSALRYLGYACAWAGNLASDQASSFVERDLQKRDIDCSHVCRLKHGSLPVSYITSSQENGSRTIVHYRDLPEYDAKPFMSVDPTEYDWIHFEGRNVEALQIMMQHLLENNYQNFSLEVEKPRKDIESLFKFPAVLMFSRAYVAQTHNSIKDFFAALRTDGVRAGLYCGWGKSGAWAMTDSGDLIQQPAWQPEQVKDTLGAGDVFNAGIIAATLGQLSCAEALEFACHYSGFKCGIEGFDGLSLFRKQHESN